MTQNIYDDETFFAGYSRLPRSVDGLAKAQVAAHPQWADDRQRPPFLLAAAQRNKK
jgi:hypothetical protein